MKLRLYISYLLLLSFFVVLTPRSIWHDCDHEDDFHVENDSTTFKNHSQKCLVCDFDLSFESPIYTAFEINFAAPFVNDFVYNPKKISLDPIQGNLKRGPPVVC